MYAYRASGLIDQERTKGKEATVEVVLEGKYFRPVVSWCLFAVVDIDNDRGSRRHASAVSTMSQECFPLMSYISTPARATYIHTLYIYGVFFFRLNIN